MQVRTLIVWVRRLMLIDPWLILMRFRATLWVEEDNLIACKFILKTGSEALQMRPPVAYATSRIGCD